MGKIAESYDKQARDYDDFIVKLAPDYEEFNRLVGLLVARQDADPHAVLDLGCGTGNTARRIQQTRPGAVVTCVDPSAEMIAIARSRLGADATFVQTSVEAFQSDAVFDTVTAVMVLHNIQTLAERQTVYAKIHALLRPGGLFVGVDVVEAEAPALQETVLELWRDFMLATLPKPEVDGKWLALHREKDKPIRLSEHLAMLCAAGFTAVDVVRKRLNFVLVTAIA